jgi:hypothetical protein
VHGDYLRLDLAPENGPTAFVGNPPYVRHHVLSPRDKAWAQVAARATGISISGLAGLHAYFYLATAMLARSGDFGSFVTSSEWLDVNYGAAIRELLLRRLGLTSLSVIEPTSMPFGSTATTAAITCFRVGNAPKSVTIRKVQHTSDLDDLEKGEPIASSRLADAPRWGPILRAKRNVPSGYVELGELCRVHRGSVTGANSVWVTTASDRRIPQQYLFPSVTRARELFAAGERLADLGGLRRVIDLPADLDMLADDTRSLVLRFLDEAKRQGAADGYVARNRRAWWSVGLREPAPILATYMARRAPTFVRNEAGARHINIAHGLYPRIQLSPDALDRLASALRASVHLGEGRTYAGGLTKFEPKEMERIPIPDVTLPQWPA